MIVYSQLLIVILLLPTFVHGHGGGTNSEGCHSNKKTGVTHCHGNKPLSVTSKQGAGISSLVAGSGNSMLVLKIQKLLRHHGYQTGDESGIAGSRTTMAIRLFQEDRGLRVTGEPGELLLQQLQVKSKQNP